MDKKINQNELEKELSELILDVKTEKGLEFAAYYVNSRGKEGYDVKEFQNLIELIYLISKTELNSENYLFN